MIRLENVSKTFATKSGSVNAVADVSLHVDAGEVFGIVGFSGAGKSTLVRLINMLERPDAGRVLVGGQDMARLSSSQLNRARRGIGMIFQQFNLLMQRTCLENIIFPLTIANVDRRTAKQRALSLLEKVGMPEKADAYPSQLSGGQKQRVAIARALATEPRVLLCDEATSALDEATASSILALLSSVNREMGITILMITHQLSVVRQTCGRVAVMEEGRIVESGSAREIFENPQSNGARRLLLPQEEGKAATTLTVSFPTESEASAAIGEMSVRQGVPISVYYAGNGKALITSQEGSVALDRVREYLRQNGCEFTEG